MSTSRLGRVSSIRLVKVDDLISLAGNATGVYGGVNAQGNGNAADTSNIVRLLRSSLSR